MGRSRAGRLRLLRRAKGLTQADVAERACVSVRTVRGIETGEVATPHPHTLTAVLDAIGVPEAERHEQLSAWSVQRARTFAQLCARGADIDELLLAAGMRVMPAHRTISKWARVEIGANRRCERTRSRQTLEFTAAGPGVLHAVEQGDQASDTRLLQLGETTGCTLADRIDIPEHNITVFELDLGGEVHAGDTRSFDFEILDQRPPQNSELAAIAETLRDSDGITRGNRGDVNCLTVEVAFHPRARPTQVYPISRQHAADEPDELDGPVALDTFGATHLVVQDAPPGGYGFRWSW